MTLICIYRTLIAKTQYIIQSERCYFTNLLKSQQLSLYFIFALINTQNCLSYLTITT